MSAMHAGGGEVVEAALVRRDWPAVGEAALGLVLVLGGLALAMGSGSASAESSQSGSAVPSVVLRQLPITMSNLTSSFTLVGPPNQTRSQNGAVTLRVRTPDPDGYTVSVLANAAVMTPLKAANPDRIPVGNLAVRKTGTSAFFPLKSTSAVTVHSQTTRSGPQGDNLSTDYRVTIPNVRADTYRVTLTYTVTTR
ncbi:hypothetical protein ACFXOM_04675 [Streptomyces sp. NPDC059169]|uniref:hypothetical protein n=1 Tax=Streptomyces sp. NPDC059169 TaxID=3346754 RepID=UPI0036AB810C